MALAGNFAYVERFAAFAESLSDQTAPSIATVSFDIESCASYATGADPRAADGRRFLQNWRAD
jgi:hypothetical protein